jgi:urea carboxylase-associated protein 2
METIGGGRDVIVEHGAGAAGTGTLAGALAHARSQASGAPQAAVGRADAAMPAGERGTALWAEEIGGGNYASRRLPRGAVLRLVDVDGDACVQLLVHNASQPAERLNVADTVKVQWQAYLGAGALLLSDMGRVLMTIIADTSERHDCLCGCSTRTANEARYGDAGAGGRHPSGRDLLALGAAKLGLTRRDVGANVNLFKSVRVDANGALRLDGARRPGAYVDLRAEVDVLVTVAVTPHPLDDRDEYAVTAVRCSAWMPDPIAAADERGETTPERRRAFENTAAFLTGAGA